MARSTETLFLAAISWCFALSMLAYSLGFTIEIGAFIAGITLASLPYSVEITNKVKPLRDFFTIMFFVAIGSSLILTNVEQHLLTIIILSAFVLLIKPLIVFVIISVMGFKSRTGFLSGLTMGQISEFSLLIKIGFEQGNDRRNRILPQVE